MNRPAHAFEHCENAAVEYMGIRFAVLEVAHKKVINAKAKRLLPQKTEE